MEYGVFEAALAKIHLVPEAGIKAFRARLRVLRDMGVPDVKGPGTGRRIDYQFQDVWTANIALALEAFGVSPSRAVEAIRGATSSFLKREGLASIWTRVHEGQSDMWAVIYTIYRPAPSDLEDSIIFIDVGPFDRVVADLKKQGSHAPLRGITNLSKMTRDCEQALAEVAKE